MQREIPHNELLAVVDGIEFQIAGIKLLCYVGNIYRDGEIRFNWIQMRYQVNYSCGHYLFFFNWTGYSWHLWMQLMLFPWVTWGNFIRMTEPKVIALLIDKCIYQQCSYPHERWHQPAHTKPIHSGEIQKYFEVESRDWLFTKRPKPSTVSNLNLQLFYKARQNVLINLNILVAFTK